MLQGARATHIRELTPRRAIGRIREWRLIKPPFSEMAGGSSIARICTQRHRGFTLAKDFIDLFLRAGVQRNARDAMSRNTA
ncbi:hypothetical protein AB7813_26635 [Tardiphaga sp. 20_F10_N6_6]|uniref:hypothetical protein n=1 Tax=Tardiphaga sp. 20_F10_N6_6 TaxID=3240788 RepID=UPI003F89B969